MAERMGNVEGRRRGDDPGQEPAAILGYCTNVHGGSTLAELTDNLLRHAAAVKDRVSPDAPLPVGLWLSARVVRHLLGDPAALESFKEFLATHGLRPYTFNAFPMIDLQAGTAGSAARRVKHRVYRPDWSAYERMEYTIAVAELADELVPEGEEVSVSTLPLGWGKGEASECDIDAAARSLRAIAGRLRRVEDETGRLIHIDLEPEPGCVLDTAADVVAFFEGRLLPGGDEQIVRRHIRVCHDVCHAAVMFEPQPVVIRAYADAGIRIGKVQVSSAIRAEFDAASAGNVRETLAGLAAFADDRYLHQTVVRGRSGVLGFFEDLPAALDHLRASPAAECRVHFHVPVFARELGAEGRLGTTWQEIEVAIRDAVDVHGTGHFEVETYAWSVLPATSSVRVASLAEGIAREIQHVRGLAPGVFQA